MEKKVKTILLLWLFILIIINMFIAFNYGFSSSENKDLEPEIKEKQLILIETNRASIDALQKKCDLLYRIIKNHIKIIELEKLQKLKDIEGRR